MGNRTGIDFGSGIKPPDLLMAQQPEPEAVDPFVSGRGLKTLAQFGEGADIFSEKLPEMIGGAAKSGGALNQQIGVDPVDRAAIKIIGTLLSPLKGAARKFIRGVEAASTTGPSAALATTRAAKGEQSFGEGVTEGVERYKAHQTVRYGDVVRELAEPIPSFPGKKFLESTTGLTGDFFLDPVAALRFLGLTKMGVRAKAFADTERSAADIIALNKAGKLKGTLKEAAEHLEKHGPTSLDMPTTRAEQIRHGFRQIVTPSNPLRPFAADAPLMERGFDKINVLEGAAAELAGKGVHAIQSNPVTEAGGRLFSNYFRRMPTEGPTGGHTPESRSQEMAMNEQVNEIVRRERVAEAVEQQKVRDLQQELAEKRVPPGSSMGKILYALGIRRHELEDQGTLMRMLGAAEAPTMVADPAVHEAMMLRRFGSTDPDVLELAKYDRESSGTYFRTMDDIDKGKRAALRALSADPEDVVARETYDSLNRWQAALEKNSYEDVGARMNPLDLPKPEELTAELKKVIQQRQFNTKVLGDLQKEADQIAKVAPLHESAVKRMAAIADESDALRAKIEGLTEQERNITVATQARERLGQQASERLAALSKDELAQQKAMDVLPEVRREIEEADRRALDINTRAGRAGDAYARPLANYATMLRNETLADRAARIGGKDAMRVENELSSYLDEARRITKDGPIEERVPVPPRIVEPPTPNEAYKAPAPEKATGESVVSAEAKAPPAPTPDVIQHSIDTNQSLLDIYRRASTDPRTGVVDEVKANRMLAEAMETPGASDNMARELSRDLIRNLTPKERYGAGLMREFFDAGFADQRSAGLTLGWLDDYINHVKKASKTFPENNIVGKALNFMMGRKRKGDITVPRHVKQRTFAEYIFETNDAARAAGKTEKVLMDDPIELTGIYGRGAVRGIASKKAQDAITGMFMVPINPSMATAAGHKADLMRHLGTFTEQQIADAAKFDDQLAWRDLAGGRREVGNTLKAIQDSGGDVPPTANVAIRKAIRDRHEGWNITRPPDRAIDVDPLQGMTRDEIAAAAENVTADLRLAEMNRDLHMPQPGVFVSRYGFDALTPETAADLGDEAIRSIGLVRDFARSQGPGKYTVEIGEDAIPTVARLHKEGKIQAWVGPRSVADHMNEHIHRFNDFNFGEFGGVLAPIRQFYSRTTLPLYGTYHLGNMVGDIQNAVFFAGAKPQAFAKGLGIATGKDAARKFTNHLGETLTGQELWEKASKSGAMSGGFYNPESYEQMVGDLAHSNNLFNRATDVGRRVGEIGENWRRFSLWMDGWERGLSPAVATRRVNTFMHNYADITKFEAGVRAMLPFYQFSRKQIPLALKMWLQRPVLSQVEQKISDEFSGMTPQQKAAMPEYMRNRHMVSLGQDDEGNDRMISVDFMLPNSTLTEFTENPVTYAERLGAPYLKAIPELAQNRRMDTGTEIRRNEGETVPLWGAEVDPLFAHAVAGTFRPIRTIDDVMFGGRDQYSRDEKKDALQRAMALLGVTVYNFPTYQQLQKRMDEIGRRQSERQKSEEGRIARGSSSSESIQKMIETGINEQMEFFESMQDFSTPPAAAPRDTTNAGSRTGIKW